MKYIIPHIPPSLNEFAGRENSWEYRKLKKEWTELVCWLCKPKPGMPYNKSSVILTYFFPDDRRRDPDNYNGKMILDGLTKSRVIVDDSFKHIELHLKSGDPDKINPRTEITIEEIRKEKK